VRSAERLPVFATGGPPREPYDGPGPADFTNAAFAAHHAATWDSAFALTYMPALETVAGWASEDGDGARDRRHWTETIAQLAGGDRPVVAQLWGPLTLASAREGHVRLLTMLARDSAEADRVVERIAPTVLELATAAVDAGASIVWMAEPMAVPIDRRHFEQHARAPLHRVVAEVCARRRDTVVHMSGHAGHLVSLVSATGALGMSVTAGTDLARARDAVPPGFTLFGNLDASELVRRPEDELVERARSMAATMTGGSFVVTLGSHVSGDVPVERMAAFLDEARSHPGLAGRA
jgi:uroporphyrinogen-III decarboxylase